MWPHSWHSAYADTAPSPYQPAPGQWMFTGQLQWATKQIIGPWEGNTEWA